MIDTATNAVTATITVGFEPLGVAVTPDGSKVYVANRLDTVLVIDTATNRVNATIAIGGPLEGVAVTPDGSKVYSVNELGTVSVINTATDTVTATITVGGPVDEPLGVAVTPDGSKVYVTNGASDTVSVIATTTNTVTASITVGRGPVAFGVFIQQPRFAGTPGKANCYGQSVSALTRQYHGLNAAAAALRFSSVTALEKAILAFCEQ